MATYTTCTTRIKGETLKYQVRWSTRARRYRLSVSADGVVVTLPSNIPITEAEKFIQQNDAWLTAQMAKITRRQEKAKDESLPGDVILLRGKATQIKVVEEVDHRSRALVTEGNGRITVRLPEGGRARQGAILEAALRKLARDELQQAVSSHAKVMGVNPRAVSVRDQRTRWGSCSNSGTLSFNWRLVMAPPEVLNYVVVHELAHMKVPNHSREFWAVVARYYPRYKECRLWLKRKGLLLRPEILRSTGSFD